MELTIIDILKARIKECQEAIQIKKKEIQQCEIAIKAMREVDGEQPPAKKENKPVTKSSEIILPSISQTQFIDYLRTIAPNGVTVNELCAAFDFPLGTPEEKGRSNSLVFNRLKTLVHNNSLFKAQSDTGMKYYYNKTIEE